LKIRKINIIKKEAPITFIEASFCTYMSKGDKCILEFKLEKNDLTFVESNFFIAFNKLRNWLYDFNEFYPVCQGALINVYPSRMSIQMSKGQKAFKLLEGKQSNLDDIIDIFSPIKLEDFRKLSTVDEQLEYYKKWLSSL